MYCMFKKREYLEYVLYISIKDVTRRGFPHHSWDYEPMKFWWGEGGGTPDKLSATYGESQTHCGCQGDTPDKLQPGSTNHCCYLSRGTLLSNP